LTSARLYLDQLGSIITKCLPEALAASESIEIAMAHEYDSHIEYRFMEALRNYAQHRGFPVHSLSPISKWTSIEDDGRMEFSLSFEADREVLSIDEHFKKSVLKEIGPNVNLKAATRRYIESLSKIQETARKLVKPSVDGARSTIESAITRYRTEHSGPLISLSAMEFSGGNRIKSKTPLLLEWDDIRLELESRNPVLINLHRRHATGAL
jgi:hypothetical protein